MNYKQSTEILEEINNSKRILLNCHRSPDPDSIGSSLAMFEVLKKKGKEVKIVGPSNIAEECRFLPNSELIEKIDFNNFSFDKWDLFIALDSSSWEMITDIVESKRLPIKTLAIDHHATNQRFGNVNLIDEKVSSTAEMIYLILKDWNFEVSQTIAQSILTGIIGDTGAFQFPNTTLQTFEIVKELIQKGADKDEIVFNLYRNYSLNTLRLWGEILKEISVDEKGGFVWSAIPNDVYQKLGSPTSAKELAASFFAPTVRNTDFGMIMVEQEKGILNISFRTRTGFDVAKIASALGGGGHKEAAGASVSGLEFQKAVEKVLETARRIVNENKD